MAPDRQGDRDAGRVHRPSQAERLSRERPDTRSRSEVALVGGRGCAREDVLSQNPAWSCNILTSSSFPLSGLCPGRVLCITSIQVRGSNPPVCIKHPLFTIQLNLHPHKPAFAHAPPPGPPTFTHLLSRPRPAPRTLALHPSCIQCRRKWPLPLGMRSRSSTIAA